ncbi:uncharacterized protein PAC_08549 [Phialocephala subalpina]|uniref:Uncharacterized protein n=1 Tax=Phialocephala subalpina TaxID=576137 RepID=A0A1L7X0W0_9HELO|nr:uncharacterized protein PAC_08549 [Phialocephala subalpina]
MVASSCEVTCILFTKPGQVCLAEGRPCAHAVQIPPNSVSGFTYVKLRELRELDLDLSRCPVGSENFYRCDLRPNSSSSSDFYESGFDYDDLDDNFFLDQLFATRGDKWDSSRGNFEYLQAQLDNWSAILDPVPVNQIPTDCVNSSLRLGSSGKSDSNLDFALDLDFDGGLQLQRFETLGASSSVLSLNALLPADLVLFDAAAGLQLDNITSLPTHPQALDLGNQSPALSAIEPPLSTSVLHAIALRNSTPLALTASSNTATAIECTWPGCSRSFAAMTDYK